MDKVCYERSRFVFERKFFKNFKGELLSSSFDLETAGEDDEFKLHWKINYSCSSTAIKVAYSLDQVQVVACDDMLEKKAHVKIIMDNYVCFEDKFDAGYFWGEHKFKPLESPIITLNSCIQIYIIISHESKSIRHMLENYNDLLNLEKVNDVSFVFGKITIPANMLLLSKRSPVFATMFQTDMLEKKNGQVEISDIEPNIFKFLLDFVYHGKITSAVSGDGWLKLMVAADKYSIIGLMTICEERISKTLCIDNVVDVFIIADLVKTKVLKEKSKRFIFDHKLSIVRTDGYKNLIQTQRIDLLSELFCDINGFIL